MGLRLLSFAFLVFVFFFGALAEEEGKDEKPKTIRYGERALTGEDFLAPVPEKRPVEDPRAEAYSHTEVHFTYDYKATRRNGKFRAQLSDIQFSSVFVCEKSWNAMPHDERLLDHHEGHFDIAQIEALRMQLQWRSKMKQEKITANGSTERAAVEALEAKLREQLQSIDESLRQEHEYFDLGTRYGTDLEKERRARERQKQQLQQLQDELDGRRTAPE